jgi:hypothetical protein
MESTALLREIRQSGSFALQENGCGSIERILPQLFCILEDEYAHTQQKRHL